VHLNAGNQIEKEMKAYFIGQQSGRNKTSRIKIWIYVENHVFAENFAGPL
jgi:hypothetical protein